MAETIIKYKKAIEALRHKLKRSPRMNEIAKRLGITIEKVNNIAEISETQPTSLDTPIGDDDAGKFLELIEDESAASPEDLMTDTLRQEHIKKLLKKLPARDNKILVLRFGLEGKKALTLQEIAGRLKITKERVRQIEERAMRSLKELIVDEGIREGLKEQEVI